MSWRHLERLMQKCRSEPAAAKSDAKPPTADKRPSDSIARAQRRVTDSQDILAEHDREQAKRRLRMAEDGNWRPKGLGTVFEDDED